MVFPLQQRESSVLGSVVVCRGLSQLWGASAMSPVRGISVPDGQVPVLLALCLDAVR